MSHHSPVASLSRLALEAEAVGIPGRRSWTLMVRREVRGRDSREPIVVSLMAGSGFGWGVGRRRVFGARCAWSLRLGVVEVVIALDRSR